MWQRVATTAAALALGFALGRAARRWRGSRTKPSDEDPLSIVSDSARVIAAWRAIELEENEQLCVDPFAPMLAGAKAVAAARDAAEAYPAAPAYGKGRKYKISNVAARVWWFDKEIKRVLAGQYTLPIRQVVVLGAGLDTRPWRFGTELQGVSWLEVDLPGMVAVKRKALAALNCATVSGVKNATHPLRCVQWNILSADLGAGTWPATLQAAGFDPGAPTLWVVEGLLMYLEPDQARALLRAMHDVSAPGSVIVTHNVTDELVDGVADGSILEYPPYTLDLVRTWHYGFPRDPGAALRALGWITRTAATRGAITRELLGAPSEADVADLAAYDTSPGCAIDRYSIFVTATVEK